MAQTNVQAFSGDVQITSNLAVDTNTLFVDTVNSRVGIGRNNPACALDIAGEDVMIRGNTPSLNFSETAGAMDGAFRIRYDGANQDNNNNFLAIQTGTSFGVTPLHCQYGGNVGIGKTNPGSTLDVAGTVTATAFSGSISGGSVSASTGNFTGGVNWQKPNLTASHASYGSTGDWYIRSGSASGRVALQDTGGNVGVGLSTPTAKLHIYGTGNINSATGLRNLFYWGTNYLKDTGSFNGVSIYATGPITTSSWISSIQGAINASDARIKKEIVDVEDGSALETLRLLKPKQYKYKDEVQRGSEPVWGFIAQEVGATLPYATQLRTECLPNIYELANVSDSNVITFSNFDTSNLESNAMVLKVFDKDDDEHLINITEVLDEHSVRVDEDLSELTGSVDESGNVVAGNQLFMYGQQVDDFVFLKKDAIWTVATSALQEVDRQLQAEKVKVITLETQLTSVLTRLDALEGA